MLKVTKFVKLFVLSKQGRSQDFVIGGAKRKFGGASLTNFKILNIGLRNFYVMFK